MFAQGGSCVFRAETTSPLHLSFEERGWQTLCMFLGSSLGVGKYVDFIVQKACLEYLKKCLLSSLRGWSSGVSVLSFEHVEQMWDAVMRLVGSPWRTLNGLSLWVCCAVVNVAFFSTITAKGRQARSRASQLDDFATKRIFSAAEKFLRGGNRETRLWGARLLEVYLRAREMNPVAGEIAPLPNQRIMRLVDGLSHDWSAEVRELADALRDLFIDTSAFTMKHKSNSLGPQSFTQSSLATMKRQLYNRESIDNVDLGSGVMNVELWFPPLPKATPAAEVELYGRTLEAFANAEVAGGEEIEEEEEEEEQAEYKSLVGNDPFGEGAEENDAVGSDEDEADAIGDDDACAALGDSLATNLVLEDSEPISTSPSVDVGDCRESPDHESDRRRAENVKEGVRAKNDEDVAPEAKQTEETIGTHSEKSITATMDDDDDDYEFSKLTKPGERVPNPDGGDPGARKSSPMASKELNRFGIPKLSLEDADSADEDELPTEIGSISPPSALDPDFVERMPMSRIRRKGSFSGPSRTAQMMAFSGEGEAPQLSRRRSQDTNAGESIASMLPSAGFSSPSSTQSSRRRSQQPVSIAAALASVESLSPSGTSSSLLQEASSSFTPKGTVSRQRAKFESGGSLSSPEALAPMGPRGIEPGRVRRGIALPEEDDAMPPPCPSPSNSTRPRVLLPAEPSTMGEGDTGDGRGGGGGGGGGVGVGRPKRGKLPRAPAFVKGDARLVRPGASSLSSAASAAASAASVSNEHRRSTSSESADKAAASHESSKR
jgi:hypothetical protein